MADTCRKGLHDLTDPANVITKPSGHRQCRPCQRVANREAQRRRLSGEAPQYPRLPKGQVECEVEGCDRPRHRAADGTARHCAPHQKRMLVYGEPYADVPISYRPGIPLPECRAELQGKHLGE